MATKFIKHANRNVVVRRVALLCVGLWSLTACTVQPVVLHAAAPAKQVIHVYAYQERDDPKDHVKHTLFLVGDGPTGQARYTAAEFKNRSRLSLATSGNGTFDVRGNSITVKAGGLSGTGAYKAGEYVEVGGMRFVFGMKM